MKNEEDLDFTCPCEGIKDIVVAMCDIDAQHDFIVQGSLPCLTLRALMHEEFAKFGGKQEKINTYCECPECRVVLCTCGWGFDGEVGPEDYARPRWLSNRLDGAPTRYMR